MLCDVQIQMMCLHDCTSCFFTGPHPGVISDIKLYKKYTPPLDADECIFGDKAYCDNTLRNKIITPFKKPRHRELNREEGYYNKMLGWYRTSIEHTFGYMKRFIIISNTSPHAIINQHTHTYTFISTCYHH